MCRGGEAWRSRVVVLMEALIAIAMIAMLCFKVRSLCVVFWNDYTDYAAELMRSVENVRVACERGSEDPFGVARKLGGEYVCSFEDSALPDISCLKEIRTDLNRDLFTVYRLRPILDYPGIMVIRRVPLGEGSDFFVVYGGFPL